jgi:DNA (cytosine-5)-methyltransferase 1
MFRFLRWLLGLEQSQATKITYITRKAVFQDSERKYGFMSTNELTDSQALSHSNSLGRPAISAIDLFSGCGGLSSGLSRAGIRSVAAVDNWGDALETFEFNHPDAEVIEADLGQAKLTKLMGHLSDSAVVFGGPPCQGFSISGKRDHDDPRNLLYRGFLNVVSDVRPKLFLMENVPNLASMDSGSLIAAIENDFIDLGYYMSRKILLASDFGVPQNRRRLFIVGTLSDQAFEWPLPSLSSIESKVTCWDAISDLPEQTVLDGTPYPKNALSEYQRNIRIGSEFIMNHEATNHSEQTRRIISLVPDGGNYKDLPQELRDTRKVNIAWTRFNSKKPSPTIDTGHRHHFHYEFNRVPTVRESARLQSFPDHFVFKGSKTSQYKQVGNAVPPLLAEALGGSVSKFLAKN